LIVHAAVFLIMALISVTKPGNRDHSKGIFPDSNFVGSLGMPLPAGIYY